MNLTDFLKICKNKDWEGLKWFLPSDIKDSSFKIVASAMFDTYHPDEKTRSEYDLNIWDSNLYGDFYNDIQALMCGSVNLLDFFKAYLIAKNPVDSKDTYPGLGDELLAQHIRNYVIKHKTQLATILDSTEPQQEHFEEQWNIIKSQIKEAFGDLSVSVLNKLDQTKPKYGEVKSQTMFGSNESKPDTIEQEASLRSAPSRPLY